MIQSFSRLGRRPFANGISLMGKKQDDLVKSLAKFNVEARKYLGIDAFNECRGWMEMNVESYKDSWDPIDLPEPMHRKTQPEHSAIALPSTLPIRSVHQLPLAWLLQQEFELHKGHANDSLAWIHQTIGQKVFQYKKILWPTPGKVHCTRAQTSIQAVHRGLVLQSQIYIRTRKAMINLDLEPTMVSSIYQMLIKNDIQVSSAIADPSVAGSTRLQLSWIWTTHQGIGDIGLTNNHLTECMSLCCIFPM